MDRSNRACATRNRSACAAIAAAAGLLVCAPAADAAGDNAPVSSGLASTPAADPAQSSASVLARGRAIYDAHCAGCHGPAGRGGTGPALRNIAARFDVESIEMQIRAPAGVMPALYPAVISAADVRDVSRYVAGLK